MSLLQDISISFSKYKSFKKNQEIEGIKPVNIIIGRNNIGKSAILDVIEYLRGDKSRKEFLEKGNNNEKPEVYFTKNLSLGELSKVFQPNTSGGPFPNGISHADYAAINYLNKPVKINVGETEQTISEIEPPLEAGKHDYKVHLQRMVINPFQDTNVRRVLADRDINPEALDPNRRSIEISANGEGATRAIYNLLNYSKYDSSIIENLLLEEFNKIFDPDIKLSRILIKELDDGKREIYLDEVGKGLIPLSSSGSGIKTVILVLLNTIVYPNHYKNTDKKYLFLFEELENNLHAHALRKLFTYLRELALSSDCTFFITTHSSIVIDLFDNDEEAQILHVSKDNDETNLRVLNKWSDKSQVLDNLGIRGSDILQSNGIIWVEGPSDRIYINKWIELSSKGKIREGVHYQCLFYGGKLLSHLSVNNEIVDEYIAMLKINRNAIVLMDSDKKDKQARVNRTKRRIEKEIKDIGGISWITDGREIENYVNTRLLIEVLGKIPKNYTKFTKDTDFPLPNDDKIIFAREVTSKMIESDLNYLDLKLKVETIIENIRSWNT